MLENEILAIVNDGNWYSAEEIASTLQLPSFLLQVSLDALCPSKLSCRIDGGYKRYCARTITSRMIELDKKIDQMHADREPGFRPTDPTAIIKPVVQDIQIEQTKWTLDLPEWANDLSPWVVEGLGWELDPLGKTANTVAPHVPIDSPIRWMGGKSKMLDWLVQRFPKHHAYVEVFGGSLKPLFAKKPATVEIVNDYYDSLINFWRIMAHWPKELAEAINALPASRVYQRWFQREYAHRNLFERAVMFGYLSLHSYNGLIWKPFAGTSHQAPPQADVALFEKAAARLRGVYIECQDFRELLERYSVKKVAAGAVFTYLDPPYMATEGYALKFPDSWHQELAEWMVKIHESGNFVLMTNSEAAGEAYQRFFGTARHNFMTQYIDVNYTIGHTEDRGVRKEAVVSNFRLEATQRSLF
jgi:DNA adenine methylase